MFDLFRSREKTVRILLGGILLLVSLSMLTYLIPNYNTGDSSDTVVAQIGSDTITVPEVQRSVQDNMRQRQWPAELLPNYAPRVVDQMITDKALAYEATQLGFQVSDQDLADAIRQLIPNLFPDGKFVGKDAYASVLAQNNVTIPQFEADLKQQILITKLREIAVEGTIVTPAEIEESYKGQNEKIKVQYVKLTSDKYRSEVQPSIEEMQNYFKVNSATFQVPEKKNLVILIADQAKMQASLTPTDAELQSLYNQNQATFRVPERVHVRHILLKTQGKPATEDAAIKAKAEDLLKQIHAGGNFADLAKKNSEDTGSAAKGGDLDWIARGQTVPEFEQAAFTLKPGETSGLVKTQYGYHIIQVLGHDQARLKPFEEVKADLATQWKAQRVSQMMENISDKAQMTLQKDPAHPEKVAADFNMQVIRADNVEPGKPLPEIGTNADFSQAIADLKKGQVSQPVALPGNKIALAEVTDVMPPRPATFDEAKDQIRDKLVANRLTVAAAKPRQGTGGQGQSGWRRPGQGGQSDGRRGEDLGGLRARGHGARCRHGQLLRRVLLPAGWHGGRTDLPDGWSGGRQDRIAHRSGYGPVRRAALRHPRPAQEPESPRPRHAVRRGRQGRSHQSGESQDPSGCHQTPVDAIYTAS